MRNLTLAVLALLTTLAAAVAAAQPPAAAGGVCPYLVTFRGGYAGAPAATAGVSQVSHPSPRTAPMIDAEVAALELLCLGLMPGGSGAAPPATCELGQQWYDTDATAGERLLCCDPVDTWTLCLAGGGGGAVDSVFGRTGVVVATASDYDASQIDNDSGVAGATVAAALDTLDAGGGGAALTVREEDGAPSVASVTEIRVTDGSLTDNTGGSVSIVTGAGGGGTSNSFETVSPSSGTAPVADSATDTLTVTGTAPVTVTGSSAADSLTFALSQHAGTDVTADLEEETHATEHEENGADELLGESLGTGCTDGQILVANATGGLVCGSAGSASFTTLDTDYGDETVTSTWDLSGALLELPNSTAPVSTDCDAAGEAGRVHVDTDATSGQQLYVCEGVAGWVLQGDGGDAGGGGGSSAAILYVRDEKTAGTAGGASSAATWNVRTLDDVVVNTISGASVASNQVTLPAGTYRIRASAPAFQVAFNYLRLRSTAPATLALGQNAYTGTTEFSQVRAGLWTRLTLASTTTFSLQHWTNDAKATDGLGRAIGTGSSSGEAEVYGELWIEQESGAGLAAASDLLYVRDEKASGTHAGTATSGSFTARVLNTVVENTIAGASLATNQVTLPAGSYRLTARAPAFNVTGHRIKWRNTSDGTDACLGSPEFARSNTAGDGGDSTNSTIMCRFTIAATKTFELQHRVETTNVTTGLGRATSFGITEVYAEVWIEKE